MQGIKIISEFAKDDIMLKEMYMDCIAICLREIKNWTQIKEANTKKNESIIQWKKVLRESVLCLKSLW